VGQTIALCRLPPRCRGRRPCQTTEDDGLPHRLAQSRSPKCRGSNVLDTSASSSGRVARASVRLGAGTPVLALQFRNAELPALGPQDLVKALSLDEVEAISFLHDTSSKTVHRMEAGVSQHAWTISEIMGIVGHLNESAGIARLYDSAIRRVPRLEAKD